MFIENVLNLSGMFDMKKLTSYGSSSLRVLNYFGPLLGIIVYMLILGNMFVYLFNLLPMLYLYYGPMAAWAITTLGFWFVVNIWFNHSLGMTVKPGWLKDFYLTEETKSEVKMRKEDILHHKNEKTGNDLSSLMKHSYWEIDAVLDPKGKKCEKCTWLEEADEVDREKFGALDVPFKPLRFHHCSICADWIMNMDHHCPWFNNWVGLHNYRFFLLFLLNLWLSNIYMLILLFKCSGHPFFYRYGSCASLAMGLHIGLFFGMGFFNGWQWYLWLKGIPQVEYIQTRVTMAIGGSSGSLHDYGLKSWRDNLYVTFGTKNLLSMFMPSLRSLPLYGLEYSAQRKASNRFN